MSADRSMLYNKQAWRDMNDIFWICGEGSISWRSAILTVEMT